jgi:hypothetical protein
MDARGRRTLAWGLGLFVAGQLAFFAAKEYWRPELTDPEYGLRLARLRARMAEGPPGRPLVVALGSSRVAMGLRPDALAADAAADGSAPLVFNFGRVASGPMMHLVTLKRLLADGVRPDLLLVEVWPAYLSRYQSQEFQEAHIDPRTLQRRDLPLLVRCYSDPGRLRREWRQAQLLPCFSHRFTLMSLLGSSWYPSSLRNDRNYRHLDAWGWLWARGFQTYRGTPPPAPPGGPYPIPEWERSPVLDCCLRELLGLCRQNGIHVALVYMPEGSYFRRAFSPVARAASEEYLTRLSAEWQVPLIDVNNWVGDDGFSDGGHLLPDTAAEFTRRFTHEALGPLLANRPPALASGPTTGEHNR